MAKGSFTKDVIKTAKQSAVKKISGAVFGKGIIGSAMGKAFERKFGAEEEDGSEVTSAINEQSSIQQQNNATLERIESIVMNIADNIYNIAGVLNAQVVSMKEAQRLQQERVFKEGAAKEEAASEATKIGGPVAAGSEDTSTTKKGGLSDLLGSLTGTKLRLKGFLKKFGKVAIGLSAVIGAGAVYAGMQNSGEGTNSNSLGGTSTDTSTPVSFDSEPPTVVAPPTSSPQTSPPTAQTQSTPPASSAAQTPIRKSTAPTAPEATPTSAPAVAASTVASTSPQAEMAGNIKKDAQNFFKIVLNITPNEDGTFTDATINAPVSKSDVIQKIVTAGGQPEKIISALKKTDQTNGGAQSGVGSIGDMISSAAASVGSSSSSAVGSSSLAAGGASMIPPVPPSVGASIGATSSSIAAANEAPAPQNTTSMINTASSEGNAQPTNIPSPIASRGSLDSDIEFNSFYS